MDGSQPLDPRKTIFVGGVPRPLRAGILDFRVISLFLIMFSFHIMYLCNSLLNSECSFSVDSSMILHSKDVFFFFFFLPLPIPPDHSGAGDDHGQAVWWCVLRRD